MKSLLYIVTFLWIFLCPENIYSAQLSQQRPGIYDGQSTVNPIDGQTDHNSGKNTDLAAQSYTDPLQTIIIDAGHGGKDPGCHGAHSKEKDIVLAVAKKVGKLISEKFPDIKIIYTRKTDEFIPLHTRAEIANTHDADLFISIHCNYVPNKPYVYGTESFVLGLYRADDNLAIAMRENSVIFYEENYEENYENFDMNSTENYIIQSMYQDANLEHAITFANFVEHQFIKNKSRKSRGVKQAGFLVLRETTMPSVLVELGFLSNKREEAYLMSDAGQNQVAASFVKALSNYRDYLNSSVVEQRKKASNIAEKVQNKTEGNSEDKAPGKDKAPSKEKLPNEDKVYAIQLFATSTKIPSSHKIYSQFKTVEVKKVGNLYKYYCGASEKEDTIKNKLKYVHTMGYPDAFVTLIQR